MPWRELTSTLPLQRLRTLRNQMAVSGLSQILLTTGLLALGLWLSRLDMRL